MWMHIVNIDGAKDIYVKILVNHVMLLIFILL